MPPRRLARAERAAQTRAELLAAARRVFAQRGYAGASVADIAEEAGYSHGAVYSNFEGKQDLFLALFEEHIAARIGAIVDDAAAAPGSFPRQARAAADGVMRRTREDPDRFLLHLEFTLVAARDPALRERFSERLSAVRSMLAKTVTSQQPEGGLAGPLTPGDVAMVLDALAAGLALECVIDPDAVRDDLYGDFVETFLGRVSRGRAP